MKLYGLETAVRVNAVKRALGSAWWIGSQIRPTTRVRQTRYILKKSSANLPRTMQYVQGMPPLRSSDPARSKLQGGTREGERDSESHKPYARWDEGFSVKYWVWGSMGWGTQYLKT